MFQLDDKFLEEIGLNVLPDEQKKPFLQHVYEELELRVGTLLSEGMSDEQFDEFEAIIDRKDDFITKWLTDNMPDYYNDQVFQQMQKNMGIDPNDPNLRGEYAATKWLEINRPNYRDVVVQVLGELKQEITANRSAFLNNNPS
jgi:hypothetical protein